MSKEEILLSAFVLVGLSFMGPSGLFGFKTKLLRRIFSFVIISLTSALTVYCFLVEPMSLSLILFSIVAFLILDGLRSSSPALFYKLGLFLIIPIPFFFLIRLPFLAELSAAAVFAFFVGGFLSQLSQSIYDE